MHFVFFIRKNISFTSISKINISLGVRPLYSQLGLRPWTHWVTSVPQDPFLFATIYPPKLSSRWRHCSAVGKQTHDAAQCFEIRAKKITRLHEYINKLMHWPRRLCRYEFAARSYLSGCRRQDLDNAILASSVASFRHHLKTAPVRRSFCC